MKKLRRGNMGREKLQGKKGSGKDTKSRNTNTHKHKKWKGSEIVRVGGGEGGEGGEERVERGRRMGRRA